MNAIIICLCGRKNKLIDLRPVECKCGVKLSIRGEENVPYATIPEDTLDERRANGHKIVNEAPAGWWERRP